MRKCEDVGVVREDMRRKGVSVEDREEVLYRSGRGCESRGVELSGEIIEGREVCAIGVECVEEWSFQERYE